jgi:hypothetical protein
MPEETPISRRDFFKLMGYFGIVSLGGFGAILGLFNKRSSSFLNSAPENVYAQSTAGSWSLVGNASAPAIHATLLPSGQIFYVAGSGFGVYPTGTFKAKLLDPITGSETDIPLSEDLFCCGQTVLSNGNIVLAGGTLLYATDASNCNGRWHGLSSAYEYNVNSGSLVKVSSMVHGRWYPTMITNSDGRVFVFDGLDEYGVNNHLVEVYDPSTQNFTVLFDPNHSLRYCVGANQQTACPGAGSPCYGGTKSGVAPFLYTYPRMHLMPSGLFFTCGQNNQVNSFNPTTGVWKSILRTSQFRSYGTSFLLPLQNTTSEQGKVLIVGGAINASTTCTATVEMLDFNQGTSTLPVLRTVASIQYPRRVLAPVILPNGKCIIFGGSSIGEGSPVYVPESFDPVTETWQSLPPASVRRSYHQVALLLLDGRVWNASTTPRIGVWEPRIEIFSPDYLTTGTRPTISGSPTVAGGYGGTITIPTPNPSNISSVSLLRLMATTHHYEANQRLIWLQILNSTSSSITVSAPINANIAPPGKYMIHALDAGGIPSVAQVVNIPGP